MGTEQRSERLTDPEVRARAQAFWPTVERWYQWLSEGGSPPSGSSLATDDATTPDTPMTLSSLTWGSLGVGTDHLGTALIVLLEKGPTMYSMHTLLRTAMLSGAQAIWMLSPDDQGTRLERAHAVRQESYFNHYMWLHNIKNPSPEAFDVGVLEQDHELLTGLAAGQRRPALNATQMIEAAGEYVYSKPPDPQIWTEVVATWRIVSGVAHALPWEVNLRPTRSTVDDGHTRRVTVRASWSDIQGALGFAYAFLDVGWSLLYERSRASSRND